MISAGLALLKDDLKEKIADVESVQPLPVTSQCNDNSIQTDCETEASTKSLLSPTFHTHDIKLSFAADELRQDLELVEIMHDSTLTAVSILNDLLLYEKVESNMLVIEQKSVHLFDTVVPAVKMFIVQASYAGVALT